MKKFIFLPFLFFSLVMSAQNNFMSLTLGRSSTLGEYGAEDNLTDGFASSGIVADYSGAYFIKKYIGLGGGIKYSSNETNEGKIKKLLDAEIPSDIPSNANIIYNTGFWENVAVFAGPFFTLPVGNFNIDLYGFGGIGFVMPPPFDIIASTSDSQYSRKTSSNQVSLALNAGLGFRYNINEKYAVRVHSDLYASNASMKVDTQLTTKNKNQSGSTEYKARIEYMSYEIGLVYRL